MNMNGKTALITGANTGLGFEVARALAGGGAHVVVVGRNEAKVQAAVDGIRAETPEAKVEAGILDLNSLAAVRDFAVAFASTHNHLDVLINNAGVMVPPAGKTQDGFELQFGVNFVAHFALTGHLFGVLSAAPAARVVTMSSIAHRGAVLDFENFRLEKPYDPWREYGQSKLADLIFALEFDRRLRRAGSSVQSMAAHPGFSRTELARNLGPIPTEVEMMTAADGAAPALVAATAPEAVRGQYWGPDGEGERLGNPYIAVVDPAALKEGLAERLWDWAEGATGLQYP